jgi:hypothetical protein
VLVVDVQERAAAVGIDPDPLRALVTPVQVENVERMPVRATVWVDLDDGHASTIARATDTARGSRELEFVPVDNCGLWGRLTREGAEPMNPRNNQPA